MKPTALLSWILTTVSSDTLREIAGMDYGCQQEEHLTALEQIKSGNLSLLAPLRSIPGEVLELAQYARAAATGSSLLDQQQQARLFAALVLLRAEAETSNQGHPFATSGSLVIALDTIKISFPDKKDDLIDFLDEFVFAQQEQGNPYFHATTLVYVARFLLLIEQAPLPKSTLVMLMESIDENVRRIRKNAGIKKPRGRYGWLLKAYTTFQWDRSLWIHHLDDAANGLHHHPDGKQLAVWLDEMAERKE